MGYAFCFGVCGICNRDFAFNPKYVPSKKGTPFCKDCMDLVNQKREEKGLEPFTIHPQAYEPLAEEEL